MFEIILAVCLVDAPSLCADRLAPAAFESEAACRSAAPERADSWGAGHADARITSWRCVDRAALPEAILPLATTEIAKGVFVHEGRIELASPDNLGDLANLGFVVGEDAVAVIDSGGSRTVGERFYAAIRERTDLPIRWLILTHMHPDHALGAEVFREAGATVIGHAKLGDALANRTEIYETNMRRLIGEEGFIGTRVTPPDAALTNGESLELDLGGRVLLLRSHQTAHTDNDLSVLDRTSGTWFAGDLVFATHTPAIDGSVLGWLDLLASVASDERPVRIAPGHGPASLPWPEGLDAVTGYLQALVDETRQALASGESMRDAIDHLGEDQRPNWRLFDEFNPRNATAAFKELEWE